MSQMKTKKPISIARLLPVVMVALAMLFTATAHATTPGITGTSFSFSAEANYISQPDGAMVYSWGYGCLTPPAASSFVPTPLSPTVAGAACPTMQIPGPTLIVREGATVSVTLTNNLPTAAGNTSILFPGFNVTTSCSAAAPTGAQGLLTCEATPGGQVTYTFTPTSPGTRAYYSGTQGDLQVEMGLYGAIIVLPKTPVPNATTACTDTLAPAGANEAAQGYWHENNFRLSTSAYDHPGTC